MDIPVRNIYYLLSYAWNRFVPGEWESFSQNTYPNDIQFLAWWLLYHVEKLPGNSFPVHYELHSGISTSLKGKIDISRTLQKHLLSRGRIYCYDHKLDEDQWFYRVVKSTILGILSKQQIETPLKVRLSRLLRRLRPYEAIHLHSRLFDRKKQRSYTPQQRAVIHLCELIFYQSGVSVQGSYSMAALLNNRNQMPWIFEHFIRNFYKKHADSCYKVGREYIPWNLSLFSRREYFPRMETDVSLESIHRKIIIETKYIPQVLKSHYRGGIPKLHSKHLYQLFSYLKNIEEKDALSRICEGILLYPSVDIYLDERVELSGHPVRIYTLDLNRRWEQIHQDLIDIITE